MRRNAIKTDVRVKNQHYTQLFFLRKVEFQYANSNIMKLQMIF